MLFRNPLIVGSATCTRSTFIHSFACVGAFILSLKFKNTHPSTVFGIFSRRADATRVLR